MLALLKKEIVDFLGSLIGYIVVIIFLTTMGLIMWVFPGEMNILEGNYSQLDTLFQIAPWVFMFLIPAITMRFFSEEYRNGTIELLFTKPLTDYHIIFAKYIAGLVLVLLSLLPTLVYYYSIYQLGHGNIDSGGVAGSYIGLFFLAAAFVAIGVLSSAITKNQIVSFVVGVFLSFFIYVGFDSIGSMNWLGGIDHLIIKLGINEHYISMSRGVVDSRDLLYFLGLIVILLAITKTVLGSRKW